MAMLEIEGLGQVEVDDSFLSMTPEQQAQTVDDIVTSQQPAADPSASRVTVDIPQFGTPPPESPQPTVQERAQEVFGFDPEIVKRATILPFGQNAQGETEFAIPQIGKDILTSFLLPGSAAQGDTFTAEDALKFTLDFAAPATSRRLPTGPGPRRTPRADVIRDAPSTDDLLRQGGQRFEAARTNPTTVKPDRFVNFLADVEARAVDEGVNSTLHPRLSAVVNELNKRLGREVSVADLMIARRQIGVAARSVTPELADERRIARIIEGQLDDFVDNLAPRDVTAGGSPEGIGRTLREARSLWARGRKSQEIEDVIEKATRQASGFENGVRIGARQLLNNKKRLRGFSPAEIKVLREIEAGTPIQKALRGISKLGPARSGSANIVGTAIGAGAGQTFLGPVGAIGVPLAGNLAGKIAENTTRRSADFLRALTASGPQAVPSVPSRLPGIALGAGGLTAGAQVPQTLEDFIRGDQF